MSYFVYSMIRRVAPGISLIFTLGALLSLSGCSSALREIVQIQEERITELEQSNQEYMKKYNELVIMIKEEREEHKTALETRNNKISELEHSRSAREKDMAENISALNRTIQILKTDHSMKEKELREEAEGVLSQVEMLSKQLRDVEQEHNSLVEAHQTIQNELAQKEQQLNESERISQELKETISSYESTLSSSDATLEDTQQELRKAQQTIREQKNTLEALTRNLTISNSSRPELETRLEELNEELKKTTSTKRKGEIQNEIKTIKGRLEFYETQEIVVGKELQEMYDKLKSSFIGYEKSGNLSLLKEPDRLRVVIRNDLIFEEPDVVLKSSVESMLTTIVRILKRYPAYKIHIEGHADNQPIVGMPFYDNLALSSARADAVTRELVDKGIERERIKSVACSWFHPIATNKTEDGRHANRRVEIVVISK